MYRTLDDPEGRYVVVPLGEGVSLATLGVLPYSPPDPAWEDDGRMSTAPDMEAPGISFADLVRPISPVAEPGVWHDDNRAPFWSQDDQRAFSGPSFDDYVRTIDPSVDPEIWRDDGPRYAGWGDPERYAVPYDPRAAALGAFRIPGLPDDAVEWELRERSPAGADEIVPILLASGWGRDVLAKIWRMIGGVPGGRRPDGTPASAPSGRRRDALGTPPGPPRNPPAVIEGRPYSGHALDSMQDRGIPPSVVEHTIRTTRPLSDRDPGVSQYFNAEHRFSVVVNDRTKNVITVKFIKE